MHNAMASVISKQHQLEVVWAGINRHPEEPFSGAVVQFANYVEEQRPTYILTQPGHADVYRRELFGRPSPAALDPDSAAVLLMNRHSKWARHIETPESTLSGLVSKLSTAGCTSTGTHIEDFSEAEHAAEAAGTPGAAEASLQRHTVIITTHGQQAANFVYAPECAILIELIPLGSFSPMYGIWAVESGHIYGYWHVQPARGNSSGFAAQPFERYCRHPDGWAVNCFRGSSRECVRHQNVAPTAEVLAEIVLGLLPVRRQCLSKGFASLPKPNMSRLEETFCAGYQRSTSHYTVQR